MSNLFFSLQISFQDPSVTQVTRNVPPGLDEYNPFSDSRTVRLFLNELILNVEIK